MMWMRGVQGAVWTIAIDRVSISTGGVEHVHWNALPIVLQSQQSLFGSLAWIFEDMNETHHRQIVRLLFSLCYKSQRGFR